ncbi:MAG: tetratricopeptide repeat protein, partial [Deltaproteobacteria bacterium]|nr:tetratricopeptide repeat protein [Deltaproteobacteria bacterium]
MATLCRHKARRGHSEAARRKRKDLNIHDRQGTTAFLWAVIHGDRGLGSWLLLIFLCLAVYHPVLFQETTNYDDPLWISVATPPSLETLKEIITSSPDRISPSLGYLAPVTASSIVFDLWIGDAFGNTEVVHKGVNLMLHLGNCLLVLTVMRGMQFTRWVSLMVAAIFAIHPLQVSSVAWLAERKNLLMTFFFLLSFWCYLTHRRREAVVPLGSVQREGVSLVLGRRLSPQGWYALSLLAYLLSLLSKPTAVTLGPCLVLADFCIIDRRLTWRSLLRASPFIGLAVVWTIMATTSEGVVEHLPPIIDRILLFPYKVVFLVGKFFVPVGLCPIYPPVNVDSASLSWWAPAIATVAVGIVLWLIHRSIGIWQILWGILFYAVNLLPTSGLVAWKGMQELYVADHYQYTAIIGLATVVALGAARVADRLAGEMAPLAKAVLTCIVMLPLSLISISHLKTWENSETLWQEVSAKNPNNYTAHYNYANYLRSKQRISEAIDQYQHAVRIGGDRVHRAYHNLGELLLLTGRTVEAEQSFKKAAAIAPVFWLPHASLTNIYFLAADYEKA